MTGSEAEAIGEPRRQRPDAATYRVEADRAVERWHVAKRIVWMVVLAEAFLIYYLIDKLHEALSMLK
jgi:hypothetical protein